LRINPDIDALTHEKITTGRKEDKFGIAWEDIRPILSTTYPHINIQGLAIHIGSQITHLEPFENAFKKVAALIKELRTTGITIKTLDLGGGVGISYHNEKILSFKDYAKLVKTVFKDFDGRLIFEPGRALVGNAGLLITKVLYVKRTPHRNFIIVDAGMSDLLRPAMYDAYHHISQVTERKGNSYIIADVVGPICETSDIFGTARKLPQTASGDFIAIHSAGAYGAVMASAYNCRHLPAEIIVNGNKYAIARPAINVNEQENTLSSVIWD
jgi:diaminopimelate decarboxylase